MCRAHFISPSVPMQAVEEKPGSTSDRKATDEQPLSSRAPSSECSTHNEFDFDRILKWAAWYIDLD